LNESIRCLAYWLYGDGTGNGRNAETREWCKRAGNGTSYLMDNPSPPNRIAYEVELQLESRYVGRQKLEWSGLEFVVILAIDVCVIVYFLNFEKKKATDTVS
jgi:hypothetical protein